MKKTIASLEKTYTAREPDMGEKIVKALVWTRMIRGHCIVEFWNPMNGRVYWTEPWNAFRHEYWFKTLDELLAIVKKLATDNPHGAYDPISDAHSTPHNTAEK